MRLFKAEIRKLSSTNMWWILLLIGAGFTAMALLFNGIKGAMSLEQMNEVGDVVGAGGLDGLQQVNEQIFVQVASNMYTSGQYIGLLLAMVLGILLITNEFQHQTATSTFVVTPRRSRVLLAKFAVAMSWGAAMWLVTTLLSVPTGIIYLNSYGVGAQLGEWAVLGSILLNLAAFIVWAAFGMGVGALLRSQIGALVISLVLYLIGPTVARVVIGLIMMKTEWMWLEKVQVLVPSIASDTMTSISSVADGTPRWVGALVLIGYVAAAGIGGVLITQRRDIA